MGLAMRCYEEGGKNKKGAQEGEKREKKSQNSLKGEGGEKIREGVGAVVILKSIS